MRGFGIFLIIVGVLGIMAALGMDTSVATAGGRVNNLGLMADRQVYILIAAALLIVGTLLSFLNRVMPAPVETDTRPCPVCAETIKNAAIKCKHCGAEVAPVIASRLKNGWVALIPSKPGDDYDRACSAITALGLPMVPMGGATVGAGPYATKEEAKTSLALLHSEHKLFGSIVFRDSVSGKYPPLAD